MSAYCHIVRFMVPSYLWKGTGIVSTGLTGSVNQTILLFFYVIHSFVTAHTLQESDSQGIYNDLCTRKVS